MKTKLLSIVCLLVLSSSKCKRGDNCHEYITIVNNSSAPIVDASRSSKLDDSSKCILKGIVIQPTEKYSYKPYHWCIENSMGNNTVEFILLDTSNNLLNTYYACDSIEYYNTILKYYVWTLDDLKQNNFTITYP